MRGRSLLSRCHNGRFQKHGSARKAGYGNAAEIGICGGNTMKKKDFIALVIVIAVAIILGAVCGKLLLDNLI